MKTGMIAKKMIFMTYTTTAKKEQLKGILDTDSLTNSNFKDIISPIS